MNKKYLNQASVIEVEGQFGSYYELRMKPTELEKYKDENGDVYLRLYKRREPDSKGNTNYFVINDNGGIFFNQTNNQNIDDNEYNESCEDEDYEVNSGYIDTTGPIPYDPSDFDCGDGNFTTDDYKYSNRFGTGRCGVCGCSIDGIGQCGEH